MTAAASTTPLNRALTLRDIAAALVATEHITTEQAEKAVQANYLHNKKDIHPLEQMAAANLPDAKTQQTLSLPALTQWLAEWAQQPVFAIDPLKIDAHAVASVMSFAFAKRHGILAVKITPKEVWIASADPFKTDWESDLRHVLRKEIKRVVTSPDDIRHHTLELYRIATSVSKASGQTATGPGGMNFEQLLQLGGDADADDKHVASIVDWLLQYAFDQRASDIHLEPRREACQVRFRIDGILHSVYTFPPSVGLAVVSRLKILGRLNVAEKRKPQDGRIKTRKPDGNEVELRLSTLPTAFGEKLVMRIFDPDVLLQSFDKLGFSPEDLKRWMTMVEQPHGIVLVTGPTGSGKTTTLYSTLKHIAGPEVNVCTIEDPIEMIEPTFNQMQVQSGIDLTFATGLRALMRQDPDIIMLGEIRDLETAEMAIQASLTGHLVLSTLHTNDAAGAVTRLVELGVAPYLIRSTVLGVMAQRLVRTLCPKCKTPIETDDAGWKSLSKPWKVPTPAHVYAPVGCLECRNTGYLGRSGVYEILLINDAIRLCINDTNDADAIRIQAYKNGMKSLRLAGAQRVAAGTTTIEEILRVTPTGIE